MITSALHRGLEAASERYGDRAAILAGDDEWSFARLDGLANSFARNPVFASSVYRMSRSAADKPRKGLPSAVASMKRLNAISGSARRGCLMSICGFCRER